MTQLDKKEEKLIKMLEYQEKHKYSHYLTYVFLIILGIFFGVIAFMYPHRQEKSLIEAVFFIGIGIIQITEFNRRLILLKIIREGIGAPAKTGEEL